METITITCIECSKEFDFSAGEQEFFKGKGYDYPKRCKDCRLKKSQRYAEYNSQL